MILDNDGRLFCREAALWRAARLWIEVGLATGRVNKDDAYALLTGKLGAPGEVAAAEITGSILNPGDASLYYLGMREISQLRHSYIKAYPGTSIRDFHHHLLRAGCIPPALIHSMLVPGEAEKLEVIRKDLGDAVNEFVEERL